MEAGYSVIFLYRQTSLRPYTRHFANCNFLDLLTDNQGRSSTSSELGIKPEHQVLTRLQFDRYERCKRGNLLLEVPYTTLAEYLWLLRAACECLRPLGREAVLYLAAAVSDFYIPKAEMSVHKMQSNEGEVRLERVFFCQPLGSFSLRNSARVKHFLYPSVKREAKDYQSCYCDIFLTFSYYRRCLN